VRGVLNVALLSQSAATRGWLKRSRIPRGWLLLLLNHACCSSVLVTCPGPAALAALCAACAVVDRSASSCSLSCFNCVTTASRCCLELIICLPLHKHTRTAKHSKAWPEHLNKSSTTGQSLGCNHSKCAAEVSGLLSSTWCCLPSPIQLLAQVAPAITCSSAAVCCAVSFCSKASRSCCHCCLSSSSTLRAPPALPQ